MTPARLAAALLLLAAPAAAQLRPAQPEATFDRAEPAAPATAATMTAVTAHPLATEAAWTMLAAGGSATDAAVAAQAMLTLVEPQSSGLGGGAFVLHWDAARRALTSWDGRETAPAAATPEMFLGPDGAPLPFRDAVASGRSVGVPGVPRLLERLHAAHGRLPWAELFAPAVAAAEDGFEVSLRLSGSIGYAALQGFGAQPEARDLYFGALGLPLLPGARLTNPALAETLRRLAAEGADALMTPPFADAIAAAAAAEPRPGTLSAADLAAYEAKPRPPVCVAYRVWEVCGMGPPSSGGIAVGQILGLLERFDLAAMGDTAEAWHLILEASRLAFADRALYLADSDHVRVPAEGLLDPAYLAARSAVIDPARAAATVEAGTPPWDEGALRAPDAQPDRPGTTHFTIVDAAGNVVSMTSSVETVFGSGRIAGGFILNNQLTDFSFRPEIDGRPVANRVEPGKRPRSSMSPTIVFRDGAPVLALGSPGGSRIIGYVAGTLVRMLDWGMDPQAAVAAGHVGSTGGAATLEAGTAAVALGPALQALGHEVRIADMNSGLHVILISPEGLTAGIDPRREGTARGN